MIRLVLLSSLFLLLGCVTEERVLPPYEEQVVNGERQIRSTRRVRHPNYDPSGPREDEQTLLARTKARPEDSRSWWQLGDYYDRLGQYPQALVAFERMQELLEEDGKRRGKHYTGGLYLLAKAYSSLGRWGEAVDRLQRILKHKPKDLRAAALLPSFKEAHYLLGAIYFDHQQWELAEEHLVAFKRLAGRDQRADPMLSRLEIELRPETQMPYNRSAPVEPRPERGRR